MGLVLKHVVQTKAGTWHYRRRLPREVATFVRKGEFKRLLGSTERKALRNYPKVHSEFERLVIEARRRHASGLSAATPLEVHRMAERPAQELAGTPKGLQLGIGVRIGLGALSGRPCGASPPPWLAP